LITRKEGQERRNETQIGLRRNMKGNATELKDNGKYS